MNEKKNKKIINVDEKLAENMKMKKIIEKRFSKKKKNFDIMMFKIVNVKNSNAEIFIKYHIDDTTTISSSSIKFLSNSKVFKKKERGAGAREKTKKKFEKRRERKLREDEEKTHR